MSGVISLGIGTGGITPFILTGLGGVAVPAVPDATGYPFLEMVTPYTADLEAIAVYVAELEEIALYTAELEALPPIIELEEIPQYTADLEEI